MSISTRCMMGSDFMQQRSKIYWFFVTTCGVLAAIAVFEVGLRQFSFTTGSRYREEVRQSTEGSAVSHFARTDDLPNIRRRLTGNPYLHGAPTLLMLGDSFLAAREVSDQSTMQSIVERLARRDGWLINIAAYGVPGGSAPSYAGFSEPLLKHWNPEWVLIVLNTNDIESDPLLNGYYRMKCMPHKDPSLYKIPESRMYFPFPFERNSAIMQSLKGRFLLVLRNNEPGEETANSDISSQLPQVPSASITLLRRTYGNRLIVVFFPNITLQKSDTDSPPESELELEKACKLHQVPFLSVRKEMIRSRDLFITLRGFHNTQLGRSHFNVLGHQMMANKIYAFLREARRNTPTRSIGSAGNGKN